MKVQDVMSSKVRVISPDTKIAEAAEIMRDLNVGALPVAKKDGLLGIVTDRDIAVRAGAQHWDLDSRTVEEIMSKQVESCLDSDDLEKAVHKMENKQVRRLPVLNKSHKLVGMVSLGDVSQKASHELSGEALAAISHQ